MKSSFAHIMLGLAMGAMAIPAYSNDDVGAEFNRDKMIIPASRYTPDQRWQADVWIVNTGINYYGSYDAGNGVYNHVWGYPSVDGNGRFWYDPDYTLTSGKATRDEYYNGTSDIKWQRMESPFDTGKWAEADQMADIYLRRKFTLDEIPSGHVFLACGHDDGPAEFYINGTLVCSIPDGWLEDEVMLLSEEQKALLKTGENLFAVHVHQNWGGSFADCGLYGAFTQRYDLVPSWESGEAWPCVYKLLDENRDIDRTVRSGCFALNADESDWIEAEGPFGNLDSSTIEWGFTNTFWDSDNHPILVRRHFNLSEANAKALRDNGTITISCSYDEYPVVYLNGERICSWDAWNDERYDKYTLTKSQRALLREGDNVLGVSLQKGVGGGHLDIGVFIDYPCPGFSPND